jgi:hypothetical protein
MGRNDSDVLLGVVLLGVCALYTAGLCTGWYLANKVNRMGALAMMKRSSGGAG